MVAGRLLVACFGSLSLLLPFSAAGVAIETVPVLDVGNSGQLSGETVGGYGPSRVCGAVSYAYGIGKYEVTAAQYTEYLNAVAATDAHALYRSAWLSTDEGCRIRQWGQDGSHTYTVPAEYANRPVNYISFWDACRFANWLHNGQPIGPQGPATTEDGAYRLTLAGIADNTVAREPVARWALPTEDEWYKAAYFKGGNADAGYWLYPTRSDTDPGRDMADASGNNANYTGSLYPIDSGVYYMTRVGEFQNSASPYGTYDQGGNLWEYTETIPTGYEWCRTVRGAGFTSGPGTMQNVQRYYFSTSYEPYPIHGFRVVQTPEPSMIWALLLAALLPRRARAG